MKQSKTPLWKKSCLKGLRFWDIREYLEEISENGDPYGYEYGEEGYYNEYKDQFDELSAGAWNLLEAIDAANDVMGYDDDHSIWDDITVSVLGPIYQVLGYDGAEYDYYAMVNGYEEDLAVEEARKRLSRLTKDALISAAWGMESDATDNNVEVYVSFLRKKLNYLKSRVTIRNLQRIGYRLEVEPC